MSGPQVVWAYRPGGGNVTAHKAVLPAGARDPDPTVPLCRPGSEPQWLREVPELVLSRDTTRMCRACLAIVSEP